MGLLIKRNDWQYADVEHVTLLEKGCDTIL